MATACPTDRVFIGVFPDAGISRDIADVGWHLRDVHGLTGRPLQARHVHSTLWHIYDGFLSPPPELIDGVTRRFASVEMPAFRVSFSRAMSLRSGAFVLCGDEGVAGLEMLHEQLKAALIGEGMAHLASSFTPHVTLLRDRRFVPAHEIIPPIEWEVTEVVLVHSLLGRTTHRHLTRLPLTRRRDAPRDQGQGV